MKIIFFGTPLFAAEVLEYLLQLGVEVCAVVSKPDRPKGRSKESVPTPVKMAALHHHPPLPVYQPEVVSTAEFAAVLKAYEADLFVVVAFGEIIKQNLLDLPRLGCINLHASLLPKYRGAAPIQHCIINGETETGVTIMHMVRKMDAGDMIEIVSVPIGPETTFGELEQTLCDIGKQALLKVICEFAEGSPRQLPQDHSKATLAPKIELEDCQIRWDQPAKNIHDLVRGVNPYPGAWCMIELRGVLKRLKINRTRLVPYPHAAPGTILNPSHPNANLLIASADQAIELLEIQLEGRKLMSSAEFARGISREQLLFPK
ncbi:MAG: methionyl-tRNA formyltransferase [Chlamydiales bacterium]